MNDHERFMNAVKELGLANKKMSYARRWRLTQAMGAIMSEASERHTFAGWLGDWAYTIHEAFENKDTAWLDQDLVTVLEVMYKVLGHWATPDKDADKWVYMPYVPENKGVKSRKEMLADLEDGFQIHSED